MLPNLSALAGPLVGGLFAMTGVLVGARARRPLDAAQREDTAVLTITRICDELRSELQRVSADRTAEAVRLQSQVADVQADMAQLRANNLTLIASVRTLRDQNLALNQRVADLTARFGALQQSLGACEVDCPLKHLATASD